MSSLQSVELTVEVRVEEVGDVDVVDVVVWQQRAGEELQTPPGVVHRRLSSDDRRRAHLYNRPRRDFTL